MYDIQFTDQEIESLKFKKILRQNLISKDIVLCNKIDEFCNKYKVSFSESVYIIVNKIQTEVLCLNCQQTKIQKV